MRAWFLVLLAVCGAAEAADEVSFVNEGVVPAPIEEVWKVFSTSRGLQGHGPRARRGRPARRRHHSLALSRRRRARRRRDDRERDPRLRAADDDRDAHPEAAGHVPVQRSLEEAVDRHDADAARRRRTHLRAASFGYGTDEDSVAMRRFFEAGNQQTIETIRRHFGAPAQ